MPPEECGCGKTFSHPVYTFHKDKTVTINGAHFGRVIEVTDEKVYVKNETNNRYANGRIHEFVVYRSV